MTDSHEIPGLAKYLPASPRKPQPGYCRQCGTKIADYDADLAAKGYWQPSYCEACLNEEDDDE
jgi:hypothetical protein